MMIPPQNTPKLVPFKFAILLRVTLLLLAHSLCHGMPFPTPYESTMGVPCDRDASSSSRIHTRSISTQDPEDDDDDNNPFLRQDDVKLLIRSKPDPRCHNLDPRRKINRPMEYSHPQLVSLSTPMLLPSTGTGKDGIGSFVGADAFVHSSPPTKRSIIKQRPESTYYYYGGGGACVLETPPTSSHPRLFFPTTMMMSPYYYDDKEKEVSQHANILIPTTRIRVVPSSRSFSSLRLPPLIPAGWLQYAAMANPPTEPYSIKQGIPPLSKVVHGIQWIDHDPSIWGQNTSFPLPLNTTSPMFEEAPEEKRLATILGSGSSYSPNHNKFNYSSRSVMIDHPHHHLLPHDILLSARSWLIYSHKYDAQHHHLHHTILQNIQRYFTFQLLHNNGGR